MPDVNDGKKPSEQWQIARMLLIIFSVVVGGLALVAVIAACGSTEKDCLETTKFLFSALLPLFGAWVGAVIAFYFSKENLEAASRSVDAANKNIQSLVKAATDQKLGELKVADSMIPATKVQGKRLGANEKDTDVKLKDLIGFLKGHVTRVPVLGPSGEMIAMLHQSLLYKFVTDRTFDPSQPPSAKPLADITMAELLADADVKNQATKLLAFVPLTATVASAKAAMESITGCQDVIVTQNGKPEEPMLGWLTNVDIGKLAQA